jgi:cation diffusion facilitator CzcD-associated flavoprotein CzcO
MNYPILSAHSSGERDMTVEVDVIVAGAGISGLVAAYRLLQKCPSLRILVFEAKGWKF